MVNIILGLIKMIEVLFAATLFKVFDEMLQAYFLINTRYHFTFAIMKFNFCIKLNMSFPKPNLKSVVLRSMFSVPLSKVILNAFI